MTKYDDQARTYSIAIVGAGVLAAGLTFAYFALDGVGMTERVMERFGLSQSIDRRVEKPNWNEPTSESGKGLCHLGERRDENGYCVRLDE